MTQSPRQAGQQAYVILNPHAAGGRAARLHKSLLAALTRHDLAEALLVADSAEAAVRLVNALPSGSRVVAVGGDGTVRNLLIPLLAGGHTLAVLPTGSGNDTARALGLRADGWRAALDTALHGQAKQLDLGEADFTDTDGVAHRVLFISSLTAGFDSAVSLRALQGPRQLSGMLRYLWATLLELQNLRTWPLRIVTDDRVLHNGPALFASTLNTASFGGGMPAMPHARMDDAKLNVLLAGAVTLPETLWLLPRLLIGRHLGQPKVGHAAFETMTIQSERPIPLAADGEYLGQSHTIEVRVRAASLPVVCRQHVSNQQQAMAYTL